MSFLTLHIYILGSFEWWCFVRYFWQGWIINITNSLWELFFPCNINQQFMLTSQQRLLLCRGHHIPLLAQDNEFVSLTARNICYTLHPTSCPVDIPTCMTTTDLFHSYSSPYTSSLGHSFVSYCPSLIWGLFLGYSHHCASGTTELMYR